MSHDHQMAKLMTTSTLMCFWPGARAAGFALSPAASRGGDGFEWALSPQEQGWLHLRQMHVCLEDAPPGDAKVWEGLQMPPEVVNSEAPLRNDM